MEKDSAPKPSGPLHTVLTLDRLIVTVGILAIGTLVGVGLEAFRIPDWAQHLSLSVVVVAIVHLLDRYVFMSGTRHEFRNMSDRIVQDMSEKTAASLEKTNELLTARLKSIAVMETCGVRRIYAGRREDAVQAITDALSSPENTRVWIMGISLNDFLEADGPLHEAWRTLHSLITGAQKAERKLDIRLLIIDPGCLGAQLRSYGETREDRTMVDRLRRDVEDAAVRLSGLEQPPSARRAENLKSLQELEQSSSASNVTLQTRLYALAPTMFLCHLDRVCFAQQYHFSLRRTPKAGIPLFEYDEHPMHAGPHRMHHALKEHFELIWKYASTPVTEWNSGAAKGTDDAIGQSGLLNLFTDSALSAGRINYTLRGALESPRPPLAGQLDIQGISLKSYFRDTSDDGQADFLSSTMKAIVGSGLFRIRILVIDSASKQALYRGYRENLLKPKHFATIGEYEAAGELPRSTLATDTDLTIETIRSWVVEFGQNPDWQCDLEVRKYESSPACFMLRVDDHVFVEPYNYGKPKRLRAGEARRGSASPILGRDMPVYEYRSRPQGLYHEMYKESFGLVDEVARGPFALQSDHFDFAFSQAASVICERRPGAAIMRQAGGA